ncbi:MAG: gamma-glutamylcyclotransferase [Clostridia bacterium]|nr:gamma-glutamylcyclotransferase [Clostridia bacterium]
MPKCNRCGRETNVTAMSMFNTETLCMDCLEKERRHPDYKKARDAEHAAIYSGDYNFPGIGKPEDL